MRSSLIQRRLTCLTRLPHRGMATFTLFSGLTRAGTFDRRATLVTEQGTIGRTSAEYASTVVGLNTTRIFLMYNLNPLVSTCSCDGNVANARSKLVICTVQQLLAMGLQEEALHKSLIVLGTRADDHSAIAALDLMPLFSTAEMALRQVLSALPQELTSTCCQIGGAPPCASKVKYAFPDGRELLFNPVTPGKLQRLPTRTIASIVSAGLHEDAHTPPHATATAATGAATGSLYSLHPRQLAWALPFEDVALYGAARGIITWHNKCKYCGVCGRAMIAVDGGAKRVCVGSTEIGANGKPACRETAYPRTDPVMITLVQSPDGSHCLLGRQAAFPPGYYSCLAGYLEAGECMEEGAAREVQEEAGVRVNLDTMKYAGSQPWPLGRGVFGQVMVGFLATALHGPTPAVHSDLPPISVDKDELQDARWFSKAEVSDLMQSWYAEKDAADVGLPASSFAALDGSKPSVDARAPGVGHADTASHQVKLRVPGPNAIAHQLIKAWVDGEAEAIVASRG